MEPRLRSNDETVSQMADEIAVDLQKLIRQEMALAKTEFQNDWTRAKNAAQLYLGSLLFLGLGVGFAFLSVAQALASGEIPIAVSYGAGSVLLAIFAVASYQLARWWARSMTLPNLSGDNVSGLRDKTRFSTTNGAPA